MPRLKIFVGGAHGTGKGSICTMLANELFGTYISASELLKWDKKSKYVDDVVANQHLLSELLRTHTNGDSTYIIDGHFALWNSLGKEEIVPMETFQSLGLSAIVLAICNPKIIKKRLEERDGITYNINDISRLQDIEIKHAQFISEVLNVQLYIIDTTDNINIKELRKDINAMEPYTRDNLLSPMLKVVVFRIDFTGLTNLEDFVSTLKTKDRLKESFGKMNMIRQRSMSINFRPKDIEEGRLPFTEAQKGLMFRFSECKIVGSSEVTLDIESESITLAINCGDDYQGSYDYSEFMAWIINELRYFDSYVTILRLGVRKIDAQVLSPEEPIERYFNEKYSVAYSWKTAPKKSKSILTELIEMDDVSVNVTQQIDRDNEGRSRLIYDVDAFLTKEPLSRALNKGNISEILYHDIQDCMFSLFVSVASTDYLDYCKRLKEQRRG